MAAVGWPPVRQLIRVIFTSIFSMQRLRQNSAKPKYHASLVLSQDLDGIQQVENDYCDDDKTGDSNTFHKLSLAQQGLYPSRSPNMGRNAGTFRGGNPLH